MLKGEVHQDPLAPRVWRGDPLVITDAAGSIVFAAKVEIEAVPIAESKFDLRVSQGGTPSHVLNEAELFLAPETIFIQSMMPYDRLQRGNRGGDVYEGLDENGDPAAWYLGAAADSYILAKARPVTD